jgi:stonin-1/2
VEIKCDILVPGFSSRKLGQIPCEDIMLRIPIPESWIYLFRVEKHFRYGSVKSAHRRYERKINFLNASPRIISVAELEK